MVVCSERAVAWKTLHMFHGKWAKVRRVPMRFWNQTIYLLGIVLRIQLVGFPCIVAGRA